MSKRAIQLDLEGLGYLYSRVPFLIHRAEQVANALYSQHHAETTTVAQLQMLGMLSEQPMVLTDLAEQLCVDKATAGVIINNLVKQGLLVRVSDDGDRRRKPVWVTPSGRQRLRLGRQDLERAEQAFLSALSRDDRSSLTSFLATLSGSRERFSEEDWIRNGPTWLLRRCLQIVEAALSSEAGLFDLTLGQSAMLFVVECHPDIPEVVVRRLLGFEVSNAALVARLLCAKGMIELVPDSSESHRRYRTTTLGRDVLLAVQPRLAALEMDWTKGLDGREYVKLQKMLASVVAAHADKIRTPLAVIHETMALAVWPLAAFPTYVEQLLSVRPLSFGKPGALDLSVSRRKADR